MKFNLLLLGTLSIALTACNGGGGGSSSSSGGDTPTTVTLVPLNVTMNSISNQSISYIDVNMNNSHLEYKLTFTNPNSVAVSVPRPSDSSQQLGCDMNWAYANGKSQMPGLCSVTGTYQKTTNVDDCYNTSSITPGGSCSFYTLAFNTLNTTTQTSFSYPIAYSIIQTGTESVAGKANVLYVQQCTSYQTIESGQTVTQYDCSNENKPGFENQFVTYHLNSTPTEAPANLGSLSIDGNWSYQCSDRLNCAKYQVNYSTTTNNLSVAAIPSYSFTLPTILSGQTQYTTYDGSINWYVGIDDGNNWYVINSNEPNMTYDINGLGNASNVFGMTGLDNSFWVNTDTSGAMASVYDADSDSFLNTNLGIDSAIFAIDTNGTVINGTTGSIKCSTTSGSATEYVSKTLLNYNAPSGSPTIQTQVGGLYIKMAIPDLQSGSAYGMYKIHTENGLCEIQLDDYYTQTTSSNVYENYAILFSSVTQSTNVYTGL